MNKVLHDINRRIIANGKVELDFYDKPVQSKLKLITENEIIEKTYNAILSGRDYLELSFSSDLSEIESLKIESFTKILQDKGLVVPMSFHYIIGANSILPNKLNNCSIEDGCYANGVCNINNSVVYGNLYHGAINPYQSGTLLIRNSTVNSVHSISGGVVHLKNSSASSVNTRILKVRDSSVRMAYVEADLVMDGNNTVINPIVNDRVVINRSHNILAGHVVVLGKDNQALEVNNQSEQMPNNTNRLLVGDVNFKSVGFLTNDDELNNKTAMSINPLSVYDEQTHVNEPGTIFKRLSALLDNSIFKNNVMAVEIDSIKNTESINSNLDSFNNDKDNEIDNGVSVDLAY